MGTEMYLAILQNVINITLYISLLIVDGIKPILVNYIATDRLIQIQKPKDNLARLDFGRGTQQTFEEITPY